MPDAPVATLSERSSLTACPRPAAGLPGGSPHIVNGPGPSSRWWARKPFAEWEV